MVNSKLTPLGRRPLRALLILATVLAATLAFSMATQASSAQAVTKYVCADSLSFRYSPGGTIRGYLYRNWTIDVTATSGAWSGGYAGFFDPNTGGTGFGYGWSLTQYLRSSPC